MIIAAKSQFLIGQLRRCGEGTSEVSLRSAQEEKMNPQWEKKAGRRVVVDRLVVRGNSNNQCKGI